MGMFENPCTGAENPFGNPCLQMTLNQGPPLTRRQSSFFGRITNQANPSPRKFEVDSLIKAPSPIPVKVDLSMLDNLASKVKIKTEIVKKLTVPVIRK
jgi:hypothetical protein